MYFVGQSHIMKELGGLLPYLYDFVNKGEGKGMAINIRGPSGWGKTRMAFMICNYIAHGNYDYCLADKINIDESLKVHFIDEIHLLQTPEILYPLIDSEKFVFVFATNDVALLNEALSNRCTQFIFDKYSPDDLREIARTSLVNDLPDKFIDYLVESGSGNPRIIKGYISRINILLIRNPNLLTNISFEAFKEAMLDIFGIRDGLDVLCQRYVEALKSMGGTASVQTISTYMHVDQNTLKYHVEPCLLYKSMLKITSKGRTLI